MLHHLLHVDEVGRVSRKVIFDALLITYVYHDVGENAGLRTFVDGYGQTTLQHVLQQGCRLETNGLTTCIRSGDEEYALVRTEGNVERNDLSAVAHQALLKQRVACFYPMELRSVYDLGHYGLEGVGVLHHGTQKVYVCQEL